MGVAGIRRGYASVFPSPKTAAMPSAEKYGPAALTSGLSRRSFHIVNPPAYNRPSSDRGDRMADVSEAIVEALRAVHDPCCREKGISVVDMGLVRSVDVDGEDAHVELVLTSGWCPFAVDLLSTVRERIEQVAGVENATVKIRWDEAWSPERLSPDAHRKLMFLPPPRLVRDRAAYVAEETAKGGIDDR